MIFSFLLLFQTGALSVSVSVSISVSISVMAILVILIQKRCFLAAAKDIRSIAGTDIIAITACSYRSINIHRIGIDADFTVILDHDCGWFQ